MSDNEWLAILAKIQRSLGIAARIITDDLLRDIDAALRSAEKRMKQRADNEGRTLEDCRVLQKLAQTTYRLEHASEAKNVPGLVSPTSINESGRQSGGIVRWVNLYPPCDTSDPHLWRTTSWISRELADLNAKGGRWACVRVEFQNGDGI